jgi:cobalamin biosynthesis protein CbiD
MSLIAILSSIGPIVGGQNGVFSIANNLVMNNREKNAAAFALESGKIQKDFAATEFERNQKLLILQNQFAKEQAKIDDEERADQLKLVALVGLFATLIIVIVVVFQQKRKSK